MNEYEHEMKWIKTSDRFPENDCYVIGYDKTENMVAEMKFHKYFGSYPNSDNYFKCLYVDDFFKNVSHWMPLPEPPEDK